MIKSKAKSIKSSEIECYQIWATGKKNANPSGEMASESENQNAHSLSTP